MLEQRHCLQEFPALFLVFHCTARISDRWVRAVRKVLELLELCTQSKFGDTDRTGDADYYEGSPKLFAGALLAQLAMLFWLHKVKG